MSLADHLRELRRRLVIAGIAIAQERLDKVQGQLDLLGDRITEPGQLAVFAEPAAVRKEREVTRASLRHDRARRRQRTRPAWARHVD